MEDLHILKKSADSKFSKANTGTKWNFKTKTKTGKSEQINRFCDQTEEISFIKNQVKKKE